MNQAKEISTLCYKLSFFKACDHFYTFSPGTIADINYFFQLPDDLNGKLQEFHTIIIPLSTSTETLWQNIYYRTRTEINSFLHHSPANYFFNHQPDEKECTKYLNLFDEFADSRGIRKSERARLAAYRKEGLLGFSGFLENEEILCLNIYRITQNRAFNLHSFTTQDIIPSSHTPSYYGRSHRALHWKDMVFLKELGIGTYDLGGWYEGNTDMSLLNINRFKEQFGGTQVKEYSGVVINHPLLKLYKFLKR